jgi:hypothetical protein
LVWPSGTVAQPAHANQCSARPPDVVIAPQALRGCAAGGLGVARSAEILRGCDGTCVGQGGATRFSLEMAGGGGAEKWSGVAAF